MRGPCCTPSAFNRSFKEKRYSVNKETARQELQRLIGEASAIAPSITRYKSQNYGEVTDEGFEPQRAQRWDLEATSLLQGLASTGSQPFALLNGQYHDKKAKAESFHSRSIFIHQGVQCLTTAVELLDSAESDIVIPEQAHYAVAATELETPQHVTISWLFKHVPVSLWFAAVALAVSIFLAGVFAGQTRLYQHVIDLFSASTSAVTPTAKPPPMAVRITEALPCTGIDENWEKISPLRWACQSPTREEKSICENGKAKLT